MGPILNLTWGAAGGRGDPVPPACPQGPLGQANRKTSHALKIKFKQKSSLSSLSQPNKKKKMKNGQKKKVYRAEKDRSKVDCSPWGCVYEKYIYIYFPKCRQVSCSSLPSLAPQNSSLGGAPARRGSPLLLRCEIFLSLCAEPSPGAERGAPPVRALPRGGGERDHPRHRGGPAGAELPRGPSGFSSDTHLGRVCVVPDRSRLGNVPVGSVSLLLCWETGRRGVRRVPRVRRDGRRSAPRRVVAGVSAAVGP